MIPMGFLSRGSPGRLPHAVLCGRAEEERAQWRQPRGWRQGGRSEAGQRWEPSASGLPPPAAGKRTELECDGGTGTARSSGSSRPCKGRAGAADIAKALGTRTFLRHPPCPGAPETAPELPKGCLGSAALLGCSKCRSAAVWVVILPMLLSNQHGSEFSGWAGRNAPAARFGATLPRVLRSPELP